MASAISQSDPKRFFSWRYTAFSVGLSLLALAAVLWWTWTPDGFSHIKPKRLPGLFIATFVAFLRIWFTAEKMRFLSDGHLSRAASWRVVLFWDFASAVTPSTIGGGPVATYVMTREGLPLGQAGGVILYYMLLDQLLYVLLIPLLLIAGIWYEVIPADAGAFGTGAVILSFAILLAYGALLAYGLLRNPRVMTTALDYVTRLPGLGRVRTAVMAETDRLVRFSETMRDKPASFLWTAFAWSTAGWLAKFAVPVIVVLSFLPADVVLSFLRSVAMTFAGLFMPTPGGSGGVEALFAVFQGPLFDRPIFIGISIFVWRLLTFYSSIVLGTAVLAWYGKPAKVHG